MRDEEDRAAALLERGDDAEALPLEALVPDREDLVEQEHVRLEERGDREAEPHRHPGRVRPHGPVDRVLELRERDDLVESLADPRACQPLQHPVQLDVLPAREVGVEARAELEQRADPAAGRDPARRRPDDPRDQPQQRRLPRAVASDEPDRLAGRRSASDTSRSAQTSCAPVRPRATSSSLSVCVSRARTTNRRETPSTWISPGLMRLRGHGRELAPDDPGEHLDRTRGRRSASRCGENRRPSSRARCAASTSRSQRISRWSETNPTGQASTSSTPSSASASRWSRMSGPSHGSPVGDSLWKANDHRRRSPRALGDEPGRLEQRVAVRVAGLEDARGERVRGEDDVRIAVSGDAGRGRRAARRSPASVPHARTKRVSTRPATAVVEEPLVLRDRERRPVRREHEADERVVAELERRVDRARDPRLPVAHAGQHADPERRPRGRRASPP